MAASSSSGSGFRPAVPPDASGPEDSDSDSEFEFGGFTLEEIAALEALQHSHLTQAEGDAGFSEYLVTKWLRGLMTAKMVCEIAWWSVKAGSAGYIEKLAFDPRAKETGYFSRHLKAVLGMNKVIESQMTLHIPGFCKHNLGRDLLPTAVVPPHEALYREVLEHPEILVELASRAENNQLPNSYYQHPVSQASSFSALPIILYVDGVPTTKNEGALGFWCYNAISFRRHLVCVLRKSRLCRCACKGWCSVFQVFAWLRWSFLTLAEGVFPSARPDGRDWDSDAQDAWRHSMINEPLGFSACLLAIKGNWAELSHTFGLSSWIRRSSLAVIARSAVWISRSLSS